MRIFVGGSLENVPRDRDLCCKFVLALGHKIVEQGHTLLNGCRSSLDLEIARAAQEWLGDHAGQSSESIISYCLRSEQPIHSIGRVRTSALSDWNMSHPDLKVPEQIDMADVTIFVAGNEGTFWAKNWASYARKLILGIPRFGGAGETIYDQELIYFRANDPTFTENYEILNQLVINDNDIENYTKDIINLAERLVTPRSVFTIMSFNKEYDDVYNSYRSVCKKFGFEAKRTDKSESLERIIPRIETGIRQSAIVLADVSELSANIFYEIGFAKALGKDVIITAKKGTVLPFDLSDIPAILWNTQTELKQDLRKRLDSIKHKYGR